MRWARSKNPHLIVVIENPVGLMQKMPLMDEIRSAFGLEYTIVHYCAFGRDDKKPTLLFTNVRHFAVVSFQLVQPPISTTLQPFCRMMGYVATFLTTHAKRSAPIMVVFTR